MKTPRKSRRPAAVAMAFSASLLVASLLSPAALRAQTAQTLTDQQKVQMMIDALDAETPTDGSAPNLAKAKDLLTQLHNVDPNDSSISAQLKNVDDLMAKAASAPAPAMASASASTASSSVSADKAAADKAAADKAAADKAAADKAAADKAAADQAAKMIYDKNVKAATDSIATAQGQVVATDYDGARQTLNQALTQLPKDPIYDSTKAAVNNEIAESYYEQSSYLYNHGKISAAQDALKQYVAIAGNTDKGQDMQDALTGAPMNPMHQDITTIDAAAIQKSDQINALLVKGQAQFLYGDTDEAMHTFLQVLGMDYNNVVAKAYVIRILGNQIDGAQKNRIMTRDELLKDVEDKWLRADIFVKEPTAVEVTGPTTDQAEITKKLGQIIIPAFTFREGTRLDAVIANLEEASKNYDPDKTGVNIAMVPGSTGDLPTIKVMTTLTNVSLGTILTNLEEQTGYTYTIEDKIVKFRSGGGAAGELNGQETLSFPMPDSTLINLVGPTDTGGGGGGASSDPFASKPAAGPSTSSDSSGIDTKQKKLQDFFVKAGVMAPDATIAYNGSSQIYVTDTSKNLEKLAHLLQKYSEIKMVEVESKFIDVQQGSLKDLGVNYNIQNPNNPNDPGNSNFLGTTNPLAGTSATLRGIGAAFPLGSSGSQPTTINVAATAPVAATATTAAVPGTSASSQSIAQAIPNLPNGINVASGASSVFNGIVGVVDGYKMNIIVDALDQQQGTDLMSAPSITVQSGKLATIIVAQELIYPTEFGQTTSQVGQGGGGLTGGGAAGVTITAGNPQQFTTRQVGVVMNVTPTVQEDQSIDLKLDPQVTEFDGFIEYGGTSVAISSGTTVTVPSGFIQPVFSQRHITTEVTVFDGATLVMGGLTRDEVDTVNDKVPVLGDIPLLGRLFSSKGETTQKRNLMIFVTANLISPGGALSSVNSGGTLPNMSGRVYQDPTVITPGRSVPREPTTSK